MQHVILCLQISLLLSSFSYSMQAQYTSIFSFGDSYTDTGNKIILYGPAAADLWINKPPFGMTFFGHPAGRLSDGRLVIDFIAQALGLPLLPPSLAKDQSFKQGANFAVAGATALKTSTTSPALYPQLAVAGGAVPPPNNISLADELGWFDAMKPALCGSPQACKDYFAKALFVVGELGWNDYGVMVVGGKSVAEAQSYVPQIIATIVAATEKLINDGATAVVVSGISPMGCAPGNLVLLASQDPADYETDTGCLKGMNELSRDHNAQLSQALTTLGGRYPGALVTYADLYGPVIAFAAAPARFGFDSVLRDCCGGGGGKYNFNLSAACGMPGVAACPNPSAYVNWDGVHLTEAAYHRVADGWLRGPYANPPILATA
ncbi:GDSL esterase/lipase At1g28590 [Zea mays]|uniref:GDSL esterase/lipase n=1 Tax=Zea mays TaxID=4577 RepID=A0A804QIU4_MAIZE|nr:GDSL esterase/lipase At1g28590 [Zea mays]|eukprot:XP_008655643.1 GDSL esterase/lipase At1g28590 [Zea mays]